MDNQQLAAIEAAKEHWGTKKWKDQLLTAWMRSCYPHEFAEHRETLQHLRNTRGPQWLIQY